MQTRRAFAFILLAATAILLAGLLMPRGAAEDLPPLEVLMPREHDITNNSTLVVTGITVPNATVRVWVESRLANRSFDGSAKEDGTFSVVVELSDVFQHVIVTVTDLQNRSSTVVREVSYDNDPPTLIVTNPPFSPWYTNQTRIRVSAQTNDEPSARIFINDVVETCTHGMDVNLSEGENRIKIYAIDRAHNEVVVWVVVIVDRTPPVFEPNWSVGEEVVTNHSLLRFGGDVTGATRIDVTLNGLVHPGIIVAGDPNASRRWYCDLDLGPADGGWETTVRAADAVGNVAEGTVRIVLDTTPPAILLDYAPSTLVARVQINGTTEAGIGTVRINEQDYAVIDGHFSVLQPLKHGWNTVFLQADDAVGNHGTAEASVFCSLRPPVLAIIGTKVVSGESARIRGTTDRYVHNVTVGREIFPVINGTFDTTVNLTGREDTLAVTVQDPAGVERAERVDVGDGVPGPSTAASIAGLSGAAILLMARRRGRGHGAAHPR